MYQTRGIAERCKGDANFATFIMECVIRYSIRDWGDVCTEDWDLNDKEFPYALGVYHYNGEKIYINTDAEATVVMFADEY